MYYPGAIGFTTINGEPKVGELLDKAWTITEKCRFKILDRKPKQTSPAKKNDINDKSDDKNEGDVLNIEKKDVKEDDKKEIQNTPSIGQSKSKILTMFLFFLKFELANFKCISNK